MGKMLNVNCYPLHVKRWDHRGLGRTFTKFQEVTIGQRHESETKSEREHLHFD